MKLPQLQQVVVYRLKTSSSFDASKIICECELDLSMLITGTGIYAL